MKKYYLIHESTLFVDPHGEPELGGVVKRVEHTDKFEGLDLSKTFNEFLDEVDEDYYQADEDGYNSQYNELVIREITEVQYNEYKKIIEGYNNL